MNEAHYKILKQGVEVWNRWREENRDIKPDLSGVNLEKAKLRNINLAGTDLKFANLKFANLESAYMDEANLSNANLFNANLVSTDMRDICLIKADMMKSNLSRADLLFANLSYANLNVADIMYADMESANLQNSSIQHGHLDKVNLTNANLENAILLGADLFNTNFINANLQNTDLSYANLQNTDLRGANLLNADLMSTKLDNANFTQSNLENTSFSESEINETIFALTDLSHCKGLESVISSGKSVIDFETLQRSKDLPKSFLKKIGLPDIYIDYIPSFRESPINLHPVFLSHTWENKAFARKLYETLINKDVQVWFDEKKMKPGDIIRSRIDKGINTYDKMILVCSREALNSWWIGEELEGIYEKERRLQEKRGKAFNLLIPITIDDAIHESDSSMARFIKRKRIIGDFRQWQDKDQFNEALQQLIQALNADRKDESVQSKFGF